MKPKIFTISHPTFDLQTMVAINATDEEIVKHIKRKKWNVSLDEYFYRAIECKGHGRCARYEKFSIIRFNNLKKTPYWYGVIAHEAFHLAEIIFEKIGICHHVDYSGEAYAYFIGSTVQQIHDNL